MRLALARVNYSQLYGVYDEGKTYEQRDILIPYHLLVLASFAIKNKVDAKIFDGEVDLLDEEQLVKEILEWNPDYVGFTSTTPDISATIKACALIKSKNFSIKTIIGGCHATVMANSMVGNDAIDFIVVGNGERALVDIVLRNKYDCKIVDGKNINGIFPAYDILDYSDYMFTDPIRGRVKAASIMSSYNCPFDCYFCFHRRNLRFKNIDSFIDEVDYLYNVKGVRYFFVYDDTFLTNISRVKKILSKLRKFKEAHFQCLARANQITVDIARDLRDSNFVRVSMGLESGSNRILKVVNKGVTVKDGEKACEILYSLGLETRGSFILGLPYETKETIRETIEFAKRIDLYHANFNILTPYPGTKVYEMALKNKGIRFIKEEYKTKWDEYRRWGKAIIETDSITGNELEEYQVLAQTEFYARGKILDYYKGLFDGGNRSRYFYRPLNFAWNKKFGKDIPFWNSLEESKLVGGAIEA